MRLGHKGSIRGDKEVCPHLEFVSESFVCLNLTFQS
jgi:hypothetical protein